MTRRWIADTACAGALLAAVLQAPQPDKPDLREFTGVYQLDERRFLYLQIWSELGGASDLTAFDESGEVRVLYPSDRDRFTTGPGAAVRSPIESRIAFQRDRSGAVRSLSWQRDGGPLRTARRVDIEHHEDVRFGHGDVTLAGTLIRPRGGARRPAIVLVHASGAAGREQILPYARFLVRRGFAVLGYDKRGVGGSTGDWNTASFDDLAGDAVAAFEYLRTRQDIDPQRIGLLGWSQAGWIMPVAATRAPGVAFIISVSGAGVPAAETTIDQAEREMSARGMKPETVAAIVALMRLQYAYARTGQGWNEYLAARDALAARIGAPPPDSFPGTASHPMWQAIRRLYFHDPAPVLRRLRVPVLAIFGELDNNIVADKNRTAWDAALKAGGHPDYVLAVLPKANHAMLEATTGSNAEAASLQRFVPAYFTVVRDWLGQRGYPAPRELPEAPR